MAAEIHIGLSDAQRNEISDGLKKLLADSYTLYLKTHNFHWNVTGPLFPTLHKMFEEQYMELANAVDEIAERIRALGHSAPASYKHFADLTSIKEENGVPEWREMIKQLVSGQEVIVRTSRQCLEPADKANDQPTIDLLTRRMLEHEKSAWMLRSLLEGSVD